MIEKIEDQMAELVCLRNSLDKLIGGLSASPSPAPLGSPSNLSLQQVRDRARNKLRFRDLRSEVFESDLFSDPAWDILLEVFVSDLSQQRINVSAAVAGARVPATTGLRWLKVLENRGLIERRAHPLDQRVSYVSLSEEAFTKMRLLFEHRLAPAS